MSKLRGEKFLSTSREKVKYAGTCDLEEDKVGEDRKRKYVQDCAPSRSQLQYFIAQF